MVLVLKYVSNGKKETVGIRLSQSKKTEKPCFSIRKMEKWTQAGTLIM